MKISRIAQLGAVAAIAALALSGCASNEAGGTTDPSASDAPALTGDAQRLRRHLAAGRRPGMDRRIPGRQPRRDRQLRPRRAPAPAASRSSPAPCSSPAPTAPSRPRRSKPDRSTRASRAPDLVEIPAYVSPIAIDRSTSRASTRSNLDPATIAGIFAGTITNWNDPAIAATNDGRHAARPRDHAGSPFRQVGHDRELHRLPRADRSESVWTYGSVEEWPIQGGEAAQGTSGVVNAIKGGQGTIGYADHSQTAEIFERQRPGGRRVGRAVRRGRRDRTGRIAARRGPRLD